VPGSICLTTVDTVHAAAGSLGWRPAVGDPSPAAWIVLAGYFIAVITCVLALHIALIGARMAAEYCGPERRNRDRRAAYRASFFFWALLAVILGLLGLNKQLDLHILLTDIGRRVAAEQGWLEQRRLVQALVAGLIGLGGLTTLAVLLRMTRELLPRHLLAFIGAVFLACFLVARTLSYHPLDALMWQELLGVKLRHLLELAGIACVAVCAALNCRWRVVRPAPRPERDPFAAAAP